MAKKNVLVLCTGNSARSQMAEGIINHLLAGSWRAVSAGTKPAGYVHPLAIYVMSELGIDIAGHHSKSTDEFRGQRFDQIITVCDNAAEDCPIWLGGGFVFVGQSHRDHQKSQGGRIAHGRRSL